MSEWGGSTIFHINLLKKWNEHVEACYIRIIRSMEQWKRTNGPRSPPQFGVPVDPEAVK